MVNIKNYRQLGDRAKPESLDYGVLAVDKAGNLYAGDEHDVPQEIFAGERVLSDATRGLYGLGAEAVPDTALAQIKPLLDTKAVIVSGTYTGTGAYNAVTENIINLGFRPSVVLVGGLVGFEASPGNSGNRPVGGLIIDGVQNAYGGSALTVIDNGFSAVQGAGSSAQWYETNAVGKIYKYIALR